MWGLVLGYGAAFFSLYVALRVFSYVYQDRLLKAAVQRFLPTWQKEVEQILEPPAHDPLDEAFLRLEAEVAERESQQALRDELMEAYQQHEYARLAHMAKIRYEERRRRSASDMAKEDYVRLMKQRQNVFYNKFH